MIIYYDFYRAAEGSRYDASFAQASIMSYRPSPVTAAHLGQPRAADAAAQRGPWADLVR